jgi:hypothetical protein
MNTASVLRKVDVDGALNARSASSASSALNALGARSVLYKKGGVP